MNREIKFRGLRKVGKQMIVGDLAKLMHEDNLCIMPYSFYGTRDFGEEHDNGNPKIEDYLAIGGFYPVIKETVGQFTGLKDKNGKEIYEGDIIDYRCNSQQLKEDLRVVTMFENKGCWLGCKLDNKYNINLASIDDVSTIVGNIHENPELLSR